MYRHYSIGALTARISTDPQCFHGLMQSEWQVLRCPTGLRDISVYEIDARVPILPIESREIAEAA